jgi:membrane-associated progesterone receptor component
VFLMVAWMYTSGGHASAEEKKKADARGVSKFTFAKKEEASDSRTFSAEQLSAYHCDRVTRVYIAAKGKVFDVTESGFYEPESPYGLAFSGRDCSIDLATMNLEGKTECTSETIAQMTAGQRRVLDDWVLKFEGKYDVVGRVLDSPWENDNKKND